MRRASIVGALLLALVGLATWVLYEPAAKGPLAGYARLGVPSGAEAMQRDLLAAAPPGSPLPPLVQRLDGLGLRCAPSGETIGTLLCTARLQAREQRTLHVQVVVWATNDRVMSLSVGFERLAMPH